ncbi:MAG TPA: HPr family phosphocarrier protein [Desulfobacterales bacterium]|jgi:phosphocarrier protein HPr|nr:HPr family phosphocarrier protein [Desulfobacterales bacterium]
MEHPDRPLSRELVIVNELGLHARSAAKIAAVAKNAAAGVWVIKDGQAADAASIIDLLSLACAKDTTITLKIDSPSDREILDRIVALVENGFGE